MMERGWKRLPQMKKTTGRRERAHRNDPLAGRVEPQPQKLKQETTRESRHSSLAAGTTDHTNPRDNKPLHPSWEAKRKMKGMQSGAIASVQPVKKIIFS
jgi:hypothetical protein